MFSPRGGSGPKHSAFCGACFSINSYSTDFGPKSQKWGQKNHEPSTFSNRPKTTQKVTKCQKSSKIDKFGPTGFLIIRDPIDQEKFIATQFIRKLF
jgi:hypothetical protein